MAKIDGPLKGVKVVELAHIMAGPVCGLMLADMGADVVKIEKIPNGDDSRRFLPPSIETEAAAFMMMNRNKRGIAIDLKKYTGRSVAQRIINKSDILIENYRAGTMERLGLGYNKLKKSNPALVFCAISGFGRTGPYKNRAGFDLIAQGMSGLMSITGEGPNKPPIKVGGPITDITSGILAAMGILAAYTHRLQTGLGQKVDTSLFEAGIIHTYWQSAITFATGVAPKPMGSAHPLNAPYQAYETSNGWITIGAANQKTWLALIKALKISELRSDKRFKTNKDRMENLSQLNNILNKILILKSQNAWLKILEKAGVPAGPILNTKEMHEDTHAIKRKMVAKAKHSTLGPIKTIGCPIKFSKTPSSIKMGAPTYGEHTKMILEEHGYNETEIKNLYANKSVL